MRRILLLFMVAVFMTVTAVSPALAAQEYNGDYFTAVVEQEAEDCGENGWQILTTYQDYQVNADSWVPVEDPYISDDQWYQVYRIILGGIESVGDPYVVESECFGEEEEDDDVDVVQREAEASPKEGKDEAKVEKKDRKDRPPPKDEEKKELPKTSGGNYASLMALGASVFVIGSGLLLLRIYRR